MKKEKINLKNEKPSLKMYFAKYKIQVFLYIFFLIMLTAISFFTTVIMARSIEKITLGLYKDAVIYFCVVLAIIFCERFILYFQNILFNKYTLKLSSELSLDMAKQAFLLDSQTYSNHGTGTFVRRIVTDPRTVISQIAMVFDNIMAIISNVVMTIYITFLNIWVGLIYVFLFVVSAVIEYFRVKNRHKNNKAVNKSADKINSLTTEIVKSEKDIKSLGLEKNLAEISKESYDDYRNKSYKMSKDNIDFWLAKSLIIRLGEFGILILGIHLMNLSLITMATFMILYSNRGSMWNAVFQVGHVADTISNIKVSTSRMFALFDENEFRTEKFGNISLNKVNGNIEFKNVSYSFKEYDYGDENKKKKGDLCEPKLLSTNKVLEDLSFKIEPNTTVAFVGKSGSGKSTILNLISKMLVADDGKVLIDGVNINDLDKKTLRNAISLVNQFPYIFDMTIKENLLLAKEDATDRQIKTALKQSSLMEFVNSLPNGIDTKVGESGIKLSGGQKQRLAIARALLRKSSIIIFDESTSSLDNFAQEDVKRSIDNIKGKSTIIIVAHRLSTIKNVDKIFFLSQGRIVDSGSFDELYNNNEDFKAMFLVENL